MPTFESRPIGRSQSKANQLIARLTPKVRRHPVLLFGLPFVGMIVASSYGLAYMTQTRYDYNASKVQTMTKEEELGMRKDRRKIDIREEYYRLQAKESELDDWEPKRVPRPEGMEEPLAPRSKGRLHLEDLVVGEKGRVSEAEARPSTKRIILGPDGKPCRACNSKLAFSAAMKTGKGTSSDDKKTYQGGTKGTVNLAGLGAAASTASSVTKGTECPPDGEALGQSTWTFLHSAAAYYPEKPSEAQQAAMLSLIRSLPLTYPCFTCAQSLGEELERERKDDVSFERDAPLHRSVQTGPGLRRWLCGLHNEVNHRLGKPTWSCTEDVLQQRWRDGPSDGRCD